VTILIQFPPTYPFHLHTHSTYIPIPFHLHTHSTYIPIPPTFHSTYIPIPPTYPFQCIPAPPRFFARAMKAFDSTVYGLKQEEREVRNRIYDEELAKRQLLSRRKGAKFHLRVRSVTGSKCKVLINSQCIISEVKERTSEVWGYPASHLIYSGASLEDERTLESYGITTTESDVLHCVMDLRSDFHDVCILGGSSTLMMNWSPNLTLTQLLEPIRETVFCLPKERAHPTGDIKSIQRSLRIRRSLNQICQSLFLSRKNIRGLYNSGSAWLLCVG
jgi:hypothetical protein